MPSELQPYVIFLLVFILVNIVIYFVIQLNTKENIFKELFDYWLSVFLVFIAEGTVKEGKLALSLIFLVNFLPISIMASFILRTYRYPFKSKFYALAIPTAVLLSILAIPIAVLLSILADRAHLSSAHSKCGSSTDIFALGGLFLVLFLFWLSLSLPKGEL